MSDGAVGLALLAALAVVGTGVWSWLFRARTPDATVPPPLPTGFRVDVFPRNREHLAVVVPARMPREQAAVTGHAGRWATTWSHPRDRRIYAAAPDAAVAARFAVRWFHTYHAQLDEAEAAMCAWNAPEGPLPAGLRLAVEVSPAGASSGRGRFVAYLVEDRRGPVDGTAGTGVPGALGEILGRVARRSAATAEKAAKALHAELGDAQRHIIDRHREEAAWASD